MEKITGVTGPTVGKQDKAHWFCSFFANQASDWYGVGVGKNSETPPNMFACF